MSREEFTAIVLQIQQMIILEIFMYQIYTQHDL